MSIKLASFDIFDTCIIRRCGLPEKIWDLMLDELFEKNDEESRLSFKTQRFFAETIASRKNPFPSFEQIYNEIDFRRLKITKHEAMETELRIETKEIKPNNDIKQIINSYRSKGFKICFISDMYLSNDFIKNILIKFSLFEDGDEVYISNECKASKKDGSLFDYVQKKESVSPRHWIHYGDNKKKDVTNPQNKGIQAVWYNKTQYSTYEKQWLQNARLFKNRNAIELYTGLCRYIRIQNNFDIKQVLAANFVSSIYIPYVKFIFYEAQKRNIKDIYFIARDGHILYEIAQELKETEKINLIYLEISRKSLFPCFFYKADFEELQFILNQTTEMTIAEALTYIGINNDCFFEKISSKFNLQQRVDETIVPDLAAFLESTFKKDILENSTNKRSLFVDYLKQVGFWNKKELALVDVGWVGSTRYCLNRILQNENQEKIKTFYWGFKRRLTQFPDDGLLFIFNKLNGPVGVLDAWLIENYASANSQGSTIGFAQKQNVIYPVKDCNKTEIDLATINESICKEIASYYNQFIHSEEENFDVFSCCGVSTLEQIKKCPPKDFVQTIAHIKADENWGKYLNIVDSLNWKDLFALLIWGNTYKKTKWFEASLSLKLGDKKDFFNYISKKTSNTIIARLIRRTWPQKRFFQC